METKDILSLLQSNTLSDVLQGEIESRILSGELKAGDRISENALAQLWGVSRAPIREAMRSLQTGGLVEIINHKGVFVRKVSLEDVVDLFDIRATLGRVAARKATARLDSNSRSELADLIEQMDTASAEEDADTYLGLNLAFHSRINDLADNWRLAELDRQLGNELKLFRRRGLASGGGLRVSNQEHKTLFEAMTAGDKEGAADLFETHILAGRDRFLEAAQRPRCSDTRAE